MVGDKGVENRGCRGEGVMERRGEGAATSTASFLQKSYKCVILRELYLITWDVGWTQDTGAGLSLDRCNIISAPIQICINVTYDNGY